VFPVNDGIRKQTVEFMRHFGLLQSHTSIGSSAQHPFPFRWHSASSTSDIQSHSNLLKAGATADRLSRALHCKTNGGRRNQMYRNDLCTWLDILSPHHAWPPIATSLPVARDERHTAERKQFCIFSEITIWIHARFPLCCCVLLIFYQITCSRIQYITIRDYWFIYENFQSWI